MSTHRLLLIIAIWFGLFGFAQSQEVTQEDSNGAQTVIADQLSAFNAGDIARAYSHAAPSIKGFFPNQEKFEAMVQKGYRALYQSGSHVFGRNTFYNSELYQEVIVTDQSGKQWQAIYTLRKQDDGTWKITGVKMNPHTGAST